MTLFMLTAVPLTIAIVLLIFYRDVYNQTGFWTAFARGVAVWFVYLAVSTLIRNILSPRFDFTGLYRYYLLNNGVLPPILGTAGYLGLLGIPDERNASERLPGLYAYFTGFFLLIPVADLIVMSGWFDPYVLFIEPLVRSSLIIITAVVLRTAFGFYGSAKYILIVAAALVPGAVTALVPSFFMQNSYLAAIGVAFTVVLGAALSLFLITRAKR